MICVFSLGEKSQFVTFPNSCRRCLAACSVFVTIRIFLINRWTVAAVGASFKKNTQQREAGGNKNGASSRAKV